MSINSDFPSNNLINISDLQRSPRSENTPAEKNISSDHLTKEQRKSITLSLMGRFPTPRIPIPNRDMEKDTDLLNNLDSSIEKLEELADDMASGYEDRVLLAREMFQEQQEKKIMEEMHRTEVFKLTNTWLQLGYSDPTELIELLAKIQKDTY